MTHFLFKERVEDFIVNEILEQEPEGTGEFHYVLFEKKGLATFDVINKLQQQFGFNRNMIGIAGLKDKQGVTRQWLSFPKREIHKLGGGINNVLGFLRTLGKVSTATYGQKMLKLGVNKGNGFEIILRLGNKKKQEAIAPAVDKFLNQVKEFGLPNYFGEQRFGHRGRNWQTGEKLVLGEIRSLKGDNNTLVEKRFKVQAFASYVFNVYLDARIAANKLFKILPGDVIIPADGRAKHWTGGEQDNKDRLIVTGPVIGDDLNHAKGEAGKLEDSVFKKLDLPKDIEKGFQKFSIYGLRRPLLIYPENLKWSWTKDHNLMLRFDLPSGAYASVLVDLLEKNI